EELVSSINGMNRLMDIAMCLIAEAYLREKQGIINDDRERINKLNEELDRKVIERTKQLQEANEDLKAFSYSVSHDLRAPIRAISGYARLFEEEYHMRLDEEGQRLLNVIKDNAKRMGDLIDNLLNYSRL